MGETLSAWFARIGAPAFHRLHRYDRVLRRKLTPAGWLVALVLVLSAVFGINTREAAIYQLFGLAAALLLVAAAASWRLRCGFRAERSLPPVATAGTAFEYTIRVRGIGASEQRGLVIEDLLEHPRVDTSEFVRYKLTGDRTRNLFDRLVGYPRWVAFMRERIGARIAPAPLETLSAAAECVVRLRCVPLRRGVLTFDQLRLAREEPLGLLRAHAVCPLPGTLLVMPRTHALAPLDLPGSRRLQPGGVSFAGRVGEAGEFVSLRDFRTGDSPRRIHWKAWARTGRPVVREYQDEFFVRHALILDTFGDGDAERFEAAVSIAASVVMQPRDNDALLDLVFVEKQVYTLSQGRGLAAPIELLRVLATVGQAHAAGFSVLAEAVLLGAARISGAICVLLEWDEPRRQLVAALLARGIALRVWLVANGSAPPEPGPMSADPANFRVVAPHDLARELARR